MSPFLNPSQQLYRLGGHGTVMYRSPPHGPVPDAMTTTVPVGWTWDSDVQIATPCPVSDAMTATVTRGSDVQNVARSSLARSAGLGILLII
ncbi:hypothetical protein AVEN_171885-1 [Araneus ventricosus]|uniref:Uncharacterized protein n=1 Tax=Araneus ventricosus TaxID=182803 RepID=A0A4Y2TBX4_ARAVE|nr:hypothetical protein AVEN_273967-1 [Araneus ventricosus]GBO09783.1 hypothetical protein AVEN_239013-1 [Araneus ventricosus]GBO09807.1 hypothetical protein AVEN_171885-1 [Araneus ventricosus]